MQLVQISVTVQIVRNAGLSPSQIKRLLVKEGSVQETAINVKVQGQRHGCGDRVKRECCGRRK